MKHNKPIQNYIHNIPEFSIQSIALAHSKSSLSPTQLHTSSHNLPPNITNQIPQQTIEHTLSNYIHKSLKLTITNTQKLQKYLLKKLPISHISIYKSSITLKHFLSPLIYIHSHHSLSLSAYIYNLKISHNNSTIHIPISLLHLNISSQPSHKYHTKSIKKLNSPQKIFQAIYNPLTQIYPYLHNYMNICLSINTHKKFLTKLNNTINQLSKQYPIIITHQNNTNMSLPTKISISTEPNYTTQSTIHTISKLIHTTLSIENYSIQNIIPLPNEISIHTPNSIISLYHNHSKEYINQPQEIINQYNNQLQPSQ